MGAVMAMVVVVVTVVMVMSVLDAQSMQLLMGVGMGMLMRMFMGMLVGMGSAVGMGVLVGMVMGVVMSMTTQGMVMVEMHIQISFAFFLYYTHPEAVCQRFYFFGNIPLGGLRNSPLTGIMVKKILPGGDCIGGTYTRT